MIDLHVRFMMVKALAFTESLMFTAGKIFGAKDEASTKNLSGVDDMLAFARAING